MARWVASRAPSSGTGRPRARLPAAFPGAVLKVDESVGDAISVHLGIGAANPVAVPNRVGTEPLPTMTITATDPETLQTRNAGQDICN